MQEMQPDSISAEDEFTKATVPKVLDADFNMEQCPEHPLNLSQQSLGSLESCYNEQNTDDSLVSKPMTKAFQSFLPFMAENPVAPIRFSQIK